MSATMPLASSAADRDGPRRPLFWLALALMPVVAPIALALLVFADSGGSRPAFVEGDLHAPGVRREPGLGLVLAGSGSNLPLTRELAAAYRSAGGRVPIVHTSIGSSGGIRAVQDGAIDIALVSRGVKPEERREDLAVFPYARAPVVFGVHSSVAETSLASTDVLAIYAGERTQWSNGLRIVVLQRERGDSSHSAIAKVLPEFAAIDRQALEDRRWRVLYTDSAMEDALASTEGGIGLLGSGRVEASLSVRALAYEGVTPTPEHLRDGSYPFSKDLAFVTKGPPSPEAAAFIRFALSDAGKAVIRAYDCLPAADAGITVTTP